ncbi:hypothetical protein VTK26DRAFT_4201 [Humicola hyalothermophila]
MKQVPRKRGDRHDPRLPEPDGVWEKVHLDFRGHPPNRSCSLSCQSESSRSTELPHTNYCCCCCQRHLVFNHSFSTPPPTYTTPIPTYPNFFSTLFNNPVTPFSSFTARSSSLPLVSCLGLYWLSGI